jgi:hypothetical protein
MFWLALLAGCTRAAGLDTEADAAETDVEDTDTGEPSLPDAPWDEPFPAVGACGALASPLVAATADDLSAALHVALAPLHPDRAAYVTQAWAAGDSEDCPSFYGGSHYGGYDASEGCTTPSGWRWAGTWYGVYEYTGPGWHWYDEFTASRVRFADATDRSDLWIDGRLEGEDASDAVTPVRQESHFTYGYDASGPYRDPAALVGWYRLDRVLSYTEGVPTDVNAYVYVADDGAGGPTGDVCLAGALTRLSGCVEPDGALQIEAATDGRLVFDGASTCDGCAGLEIGGVSVGTLCF